MASYKFMFFLGVFDVCQCFPHFVTGIFTVNQSVFHPLLAKVNSEIQYFSPSFFQAMGVIATPCYVTFTLLTIFLSFNRFIQLSSSNLEMFFFGGKRWMVRILFVSILSSETSNVEYFSDLDSHSMFHLYTFCICSIISLGNNQIYS